MEGKEETVQQAKALPASLSEWNWKEKKGVCGRGGVGAVIVRVRALPILLAALVIHIA